jgi:tRNA threonylcarbamoyl adenosine modification protein (Sua5/YciO/YrdC/YwlC family)
METRVVKIDRAKIDAALIKEAAKIIDAGGLVAFPTETVYGIACRVEPKSLQRLNEVKGRRPEKPYTLHIGRKEDVAEYVPVVGLRAKKLIEKLWPGPLTIVFELKPEQIKAQRAKLAKEVFENLYKNNFIGIRLPDDTIAATLLQAASYPVVAPSVNMADQPPATDAEQVLANFGGKLDMVLDAGPSRYKKSSTIVKMGVYDLQMLREDVYTSEQVREAATIQFLFVCSGNTCRSPMAVGILRKYLAEKCGCPLDRVEEKGYKILSAGTMGIIGMPATIQAIAACEARGVDITKHRSLALSRELIEQSDVIYAMSRFHLMQIVSMCPNATERCSLLAETVDIPDPIGQSMEVYENVASVIEKAVKKRIEELVL